MQAEFWNQIKAAISSTRLDSYRSNPHSTDEEALSNYLWNQNLSEALYPAFQTLEVTYRNSLHSALAQVFTNPDWLSKNTPPFLRPHEFKEIAKAKAKLADRKKPPTEAYLVAELNFGFWTSLADSRYENMWHKIIKSVFPHMPNFIRNRAEISARINSIRKLRNAAMHHHSIWHWPDLAKNHSTACDLIGWMNPAALATLKKVDRFTKILASGNAPFGAIVSEAIRFL